jgi:small subunit ribosomal protein S16
VEGGEEDHADLRQQPKRVLERVRREITLVLRIRLRRVGKKKQPNYRLVIADSRAPRDGAFVETIGTYNPLTQPATITVNEARAREWLSKGAVPSERAAQILASQGIGEAPSYTPKQKKAEEEPTGATEA